MSIDQSDRHNQISPDHEAYFSDSLQGIYPKTLTTVCKLDETFFSLDQARKPKLPNYQNLSSSFILSLEYC